MWLYFSRLQCSFILADYSAVIFLVAGCRLDDRSLGFLMGIGYYRSSFVGVMRT